MSEGPLYCRTLRRCVFSFRVTRFLHVRVARAGFPWQTGSASDQRGNGITQLKAQGPSRTCNESKEEEEASEQRGNTLKRLKDFYLKANARIWP